MKTLANEIFFAQVETEISAGRSVRFKVKGHSMYPLLRDGKDEVTISPLTCDPSVYDIVLFRYRGKHILHRIISIEGDTYTIQGDGIYISCEKCTREDIIGVVTQIHKKNGLEINTSWGLFRFNSWCWYKLFFMRRFILAVLRKIFF
jgi:signal peptidase I